MNKEFTICLCLVVIGGLGWAGNKEYEKYQARKLAAAQPPAAVVAQQGPGSQQPKGVTDPQEKKRQESETQRQQKVSEETAARAEIQDQLKTLKVSSILLGSPSLAIINKKSYEEGGDLPLPNGKMLKIAAIKNDVVVLAYGGQTFQIGLPTAKDIGGEAR
jgi:hypothetical protein